MVMDPSFTEFSSSINGLEFDDDTISPTFDQFKTLANTFKFKDDPVDLNFMDCPYVHPYPNAALVSLTSNGSSEVDSPDDGDLSDDVFKHKLNTHGREHGAEAQYVP